MSIERFVGRYSEEGVDFQGEGVTRNKTNFRHHKTIIHLYYNIHVILFVIMLTKLLTR